MNEMSSSYLATLVNGEHYKVPATVKEIHRTRPRYFRPEAPGSTSSLPVPTGYVVRTSVKMKEIVLQNAPKVMCASSLLSALQLTSTDGAPSKKLQFSTLTAQDVVRISEFQVTHRDLYTTTDRAPVKDGVLDRRLVSLYMSVSTPLMCSNLCQGTSEKNTFCETCGLNAVDCVGHYAYIKLVVPVFHIGYFKHTIAILQCICKVCSHVSQQSPSSPALDVCSCAAGRAGKTNVPQKVSQTEH
jgi:RNA polymerase Rpb1, domain 1